MLIFFFFRSVIYAASIQSYVSSVNKDALPGTGSNAVAYGSEKISVSPFSYNTSNLYLVWLMSYGINSSNRSVYSIFRIWFTLPSQLLKSPTTLALTQPGTWIQNATPSVPSKFSFLAPNNSLIRKPDSTSSSPFTTCITFSRSAE